jgi:hypothetical protein
MPLYWCAVAVHSFLALRLKRSTIFSRKTEIATHVIWYRFSFSPPPLPPPSACAQWSELHGAHRRAQFGHTDDRIDHRGDLLGRQRRPHLWCHPDVLPQRLTRGTYFDCSFAVQSLCSYGITRVRLRLLIERVGPHLLSRVPYRRRSLLDTVRGHTHAASPLARTPTPAHTHIPIATRNIAVPRVHAFAKEYSLTCRLYVIMTVGILCTLGVLWELRVVRTQSQHSRRKAHSRATSNFKSLAICFSAALSFSDCWCQLRASGSKKEKYKAHLRVLLFLFSMLFLFSCAVGYKGAFTQRLNTWYSPINCSL